MTRTTFAIVVSLLLVGCSGRNLPATVQPVVQLWDVGNVFFLPQRTLIIEVWSDGKVVSRVDERNQMKLHFHDGGQASKAAIMIGSIEPPQVSQLLERIQKTGFFSLGPSSSGMISVDGPGVVFAAYCGGRTNRIGHIGVEDAEYHDRMTAPEQQAFRDTWDRSMGAARSIQVQNWRPLTPQDKIETAIPWITKTRKN